MNRNPIASFVRMLFSRKTPAVVGGIVLFTALLALEGVRFTQWMNSASTFFSAPLVGGVTSTMNEADGSGLKRSAPMNEIAPFRTPFTTEDTMLIQGAKDKVLPHTTLLDTSDTLNGTAESQAQSSEPAMTGSEATTMTIDNSVENVADATVVLDQTALPVAQPVVPQAPAAQVPSAPPAQPQAVQPPPLPTATTVPLPTVIPTEVPPAPTEVPPPPPPPTEVPPPPPALTEVPPPPPPPQGDDDDGEDDNGDDDNDNGDDDNDDGEDD